LTTKCVRYLSMPCFEEALKTEALVHFALRGYYIFQDYAVAKWQGHFNQLIEKVKHPNEEKYRSSDDGSVRTHRAVPEAVMQQLQDVLQDVLRGFTTKYETAFTETPGVTVDLGAWDEFAHIEDREDLYMDLCLIKDHIQQQQRAAYEVRNTISIPALATAVTNIRSFLEDPVQEPFKIELSTYEQERLHEFYGDRRYKCPKVECYEFLHGFTNRSSRKKHVNKHDRPYSCDVPQCAGDLGFASAHDLKQHQRRFHPTLGTDSMETFDPLESLTSTPETSAKWPCPQCPKRFTRGFHMRNHIRTHSNERPFSCTECGKSFTRDYDRKRHEKTVHNGR
jgi:hypothetical protein